MQVRRAEMLPYRPRASPAHRRLLMDIQTVNNLPAASHDETVRCLVAIELSKKSWLVAVNTPLSAKISRYTLKGCDWQGLLKLIERIVARVTRELGRPAEV